MYIFIQTLMLSAQKHILPLTVTQSEVAVLFDTTKTKKLFFQ